MFNMQSRMNELQHINTSCDTTHIKGIGFNKPYKFKHDSVRIHFTLVYSKPSPGVKTASPFDNVRLQKLANDTVNKYSK
jgi:hypothetical protein